MGLTVADGAVPVEGAITMWGPPGSGKTTFLAALDVALIRQDRGWRLAGRDAASEEALIRYTANLSQGKRFPSATLSVEQHSWQLSGPIGAKPGRHLSLRRQAPDREVKIDLELVDTPGELAGPREYGKSDALIDAMERSAGIVFFFDPIREFDLGDSFDHVFGVLTRLSRRVQDRMAEGRLPHRVAVCITKFDDLQVFESARRLDLLAVSDDPEELPRVPDEDARAFFDSLCQVSDSGNAGLVLKVFEQYFHPERVRYFATSAIGFYVDPRIRRFDPDDPQNILPGDELSGARESRIRGAIYPINVVEPLLWLATSVAESKP